MKACITRFGLFALALAILVLVLPGATHAAPASSGQAARSVLVKFHNATKFPLTRSDAYLLHGAWVTTPPLIVAPGATVTWSSESNGFMTGTEGVVDYFLPNAPQLNNMPNGLDVCIRWDNPFVGSNHYKGEAPPWFKLTRSGGSGKNATVTITLTQVIDQVQLP